MTAADCVVTQVATQPRMLPLNTDRELSEKNPERQGRAEILQSGEQSIDRLSDAVNSPRVYSLCVDLAHGVNLAKPDGNIVGKRIRECRSVEIQF